MDNDFPEALYIEQQIMDYINNPLIEALPPIMSFSEAARKMSVLPPVREEERELSIELRFHCMQRLFDFFQPFETHLSLERKISAIIRQGYISRNPLDKDHVIYMNKSYKDLMEGKMPEIDKTNTKKRVQGFVIIGVSGIGKTTGVDRVLNIYPQVIRHKEYKGKPLCITQIPWIKIECPADGSTKGLCNKFFIELDKILGTEYFARYNSKSQDTLLPLMGHVARLHNIGILIVDEIQHLSLQKSGGAEKMLNFFVTLVNSIGIPVVLIGTNKAFSILNGEFRQALRGTGQGSTSWQRMEKSRTWDLLMNSMFKYQWTKYSVEPTDELKDVLYEESQGVLDLAKKIFYLAQMEAVFTRREKITVDIIKRSSREYLGLLKPMLNALKSGDMDKIKKYEDLKPIDFDEYVDDLKEKIILDRFMNYEAERSKEAEKEMQSKLVVMLSEKVRESKIVQDAVKEVIKKINPLSNDINELYEKALVIAEDKVAKKHLISKRKNDKVKYQKDDLRYLAQQAIENKQSVYESLLINGVIKNPYKNMSELVYNIDDKHQNEEAG